MRKQDHGPPRAAGHSTGRPSITSTYPATGTGGAEIQKFGHVKDRRWVVGLVFPQKCLLKVNEKDRRSSFLDSILLGGFIFATDRRSFWGLLVCASRKERIVGRDRRSGGVCMACVHSFIRGYNIL